MIGYGLNNLNTIWILSHKYVKLECVMPFSITLTNIKEMLPNWFILLLLINVI